MKCTQFLGKRWWPSLQIPAYEEFSDKSCCCMSSFCTSVSPLVSNGGGQVTSPSSQIWPRSYNLVILYISGGKPKTITAQSSARCIYRLRSPAASFRVQVSCFQCMKRFIYSFGSNLECVEGSSRVGTGE